MSKAPDPGQMIFDFQWVKMEASSKIIQATAYWTMIRDALRWVGASTSGAKYSIGRHVHCQTHSVNEKSNLLPEAPSDEIFSKRDTIIMITSIHPNLGIVFQAIPEEDCLPSESRNSHNGSRSVL